MKKMKKVLAVLMTATMLGSISLTAMAANEVPAGTAETPTPVPAEVVIKEDAATGALQVDKSLTVSGLDKGDVVKFYKLVEWIPGEGWAYTKAITDSGAALPELKTITGYYDETAKKVVPGAVSAADGGKLAVAAQKAASSLADTETVADGASSVTYTFPALTDNDDPGKYAGLYVALISAATPDYLYNPVFVAADFYEDQPNATDKWEVKVDELTYSDTALAKKETVSIEKTSGDEDPLMDVNVGDTIPFTITSIIPAFSTSYQDPKYAITDKMSKGLVFDEDTAYTVEVREKGTGSYSDLGSDNYEFALDSDKCGFTVTVKSAYLKANTTVKDIKITYSATVEEIDENNVIQKENEATVKFSNDPGDSNSYSLLEDRTNHYTFSIDASLLGNKDWENSELVKIGLNADGTEITQETLDNGTEAGVLEGAEFGLYTDDACTKLYTNTVFTTGKVTSDKHGKLKIEGLDAGTYYLKEISAPSGYIKGDDVYQIDITANYLEKEAGEYTNSDGILVKYGAYEYLDDYDVKVTNLTTKTDITSNFKITNSGEYEKIAISSSAGDTTTKLSNTKGTELPATGGIGTTLFYLIGSILVIGAGVVLVAKRRMSME